MRLLMLNVHETPVSSLACPEQLYKRLAPGPAAAAPRAPLQIAEALCGDVCII
jgi:hypothetical protein